MDTAVVTPLRVAALAQTTASDFDNLVTACTSACPSGTCVVNRLSTRVRIRSSPFSEKYAFNTATSTYQKGSLPCKALRFAFRMPSVC
eukprot:5988330-Amphidinium_carterae.1